MSITASFVPDLVGNMGSVKLLFDMKPCPLPCRIRSDTVYFNGVGWRVDVDIMHEDCPLFVGLYLTCTYPLNEVDALRKNICCKTQSLRYSVVSRSKDFPDFGRLDSDVFEFLKMYRKWGYGQFILYEDLVNPQFPFMKNDTVRFEISLKVQYQYNKNVVLFNQSNLFLQNIFKNNLCADFILKTVDGESIHVHKLILMTNSSVFLALFNSDCYIENNTNEMTIIGYSSKSVKLMIYFLYGYHCAEMEMDYDIGKELFDLANHYNINALKSQMVQYLRDKISFSNFIDLFVWCKLRDLQYLKLEIAQFFKINYKAINNLPEWKNLSHSDPLLSMSIAFGSACLPYHCYFE